MQDGLTRQRFLCLGNQLGDDIHHRPLDILLDAVAEPAEADSDREREERAEQEQQEDDSDMPDLLNGGGLVYQFESPGSSQTAQQDRSTRVLGSSGILSK